MPIDEVLQVLSARSDVTIDNTDFAHLTTLHIGGSPQVTIRCRSRDAVSAAVTLLDAHRIPLLIVGGGSNLVVADGDIPVVVVVMECNQIVIDPDTGMVEAEGGAIWDDVVAQTVAAGLGGIECLSGIPGSTGATPVQNVGAYGAEVSDVLQEVELYHRRNGEREWVKASTLELGYRYSNLKFTNRAVVLNVRMQLNTDGLSAPLRFGELAKRLGVEGGTQVPVADVREAVLELRKNKGMVYDETDHDTWSAGSFFTNPIVDDWMVDRVRRLVGPEAAATMPSFDVSPGKKKLSAAWLIEQAGFEKGYPGTGPARLSTKHTLALTNRGEATTEDIVELAREIRDGVFITFGVTLVPEPVWVGIQIEE